MDATTKTPPSPPPSSYPDDYSDANSSDAERRKYQRGGRKGATSKKKSRLGAVPEATPSPDSDVEEGLGLEEDAESREGTETDEEAGEEEETIVEDRPENNYDDDFMREARGRRMKHAHPPCAECAARKAAASKPAARPESSQAQAKAAEKPKENPFQTGIRAFNLRKARGSAGRPIGVRNYSEKKEGRTKVAADKKKKAKARKSIETEDDFEETEDGGEEEKEKPMQIRLDLNLVVEIFLKAKIQGDVTITLLD